MTATQAPQPAALPGSGPLRRPGERAGKRPAKARPLFDPAITRRAVVDAFIKANPRAEARNPVMFVVWVGSILATLIFFRDLRSSTAAENVFAGLTALFLWFTVLFANFAEAMAEGRGKAQADNLRRTRSETVARVRRDGDDRARSRARRWPWATSAWSPRAM